MVAVWVRVEGVVALRWIGDVDLVVVSPIGIATLEVVTLGLGRGVEAAQVATALTPDRFPPAPGSKLLRLGHREIAPIHASRTQSWLSHDQMWGEENS